MSGRSASATLRSDSARAADSFSLPRRLLLLLVDRRELFDLDLPFELELPQLDEQLALLGDQRLGLALQRADAFARALGRRLAPARRALLAEDAERQHADERVSRAPPAFAKAPAGPPSASREGGSPSEPEPRRSSY